VKGRRGRVFLGKEKETRAANQNSFAIQKKQKQKLRQS